DERERGERRNCCIGGSASHSNHRTGLRYPLLENTLQIRALRLNLFHPKAVVSITLDTKLVQHIPSPHRRRQAVAGSGDYENSKNLPFLAD
ncbi:hypothetical protein TSMEX_001209, partial [Taenia solium]